MKTREEKLKQFISALDAVFNDCENNEEETDEEETISDNDLKKEYDKMIIDLNNRKELKTLITRLVSYKDKEDAWSEFIYQVLTIKNKKKVLDVWNKNNKEFHWYMIRIIANQFKSSTSHFYRQYRRVSQYIDDNSHQLLDYANDITFNNDDVNTHSFYDCFITNDDQDLKIDNELIITEINWFINNKLNFYEQEIYKMYYQEELSHLKISKITHIPATSIGNTVRIVLSKIKKHLKSTGIINDNHNNI